MGYYTDYRGIRCFDPDNTENIIYVRTSPYEMSKSLSDLLSLAKLHFGEGANLHNIVISSERIQTSCIGYDGHDPSDHTDYIILEHLKPK